MAAFMTSRIGAEMPTGGSNAGATGEGTAALVLPWFLREPFSAAMSQSILLPAFIALFGVVATLFLVDFTGPASTREPSSGSEDGLDDDFDDYVECIIRREPRLDRQIQPAHDERDAGPLAARVVRAHPARSAAWRSDPVELLADPVPPPLIGLAHNGSHVDDERRFRPVNGWSPRRNKHRADPDENGTHGRHSFRAE
jgi:hypothetical protein